MIAMVLLLALSITTFSATISRNTPSGTSIYGTLFGANVEKVISHGFRPRITFRATKPHSKYAVATRRAMATTKSFVFIVFSCNNQ